VRGNALTVVEHLDGARRDPCPHRFAQQHVRHRIEVLVDLDVVIDPDAALLPFGVHVRSACLADETAAQDTLKQNWSKYSATDKTRCVGMVTTGGPASYVELLSCVEILRDARNIGNADALENDNESVSMRRSRDNGRPVRFRRRHPI
jgi:hypothetical protein